MDIPQDLAARLKKINQHHVLHGWNDLSETQQKALLKQIDDLDLDEVHRLYALRDQKFSLPARDRVRPIDWIDAKPAANEQRRLGEQAYRDGRIAILIVAGGQGTRLNFDKPKGMFPIGPVTGNTLFQIHTEKVLALRRRYGTAVPLLMMTSPATHADTVAYFEEQKFFGFPKEDVFFFCQDTMPALDLATGKVLLEERGRLLASPNGHGGVLTALHKTGLLRELGRRGVEHIYYFQVDNPMIDVVDFDFIGGHLAARAEVSAKVVPKEKPGDKLGVFAEVDGRLTIIEYSDLPDDWSRETDASGRLRFWAGSPAIHLFEVPFLERVAASAALPWHVARKKAPCLNDAGELVEPTKENALKFEKFIFDILPLADRWTLQPTTRAKEFVPLKNAEGADSPATVKAALSELAAQWLRQAGANLPEDAGRKHPIEISPLFALDAPELGQKLPRGFTVDGPTCLR